MHRIAAAVRTRVRIAVATTSVQGGRHEPEHVRQRLQHCTRRHEVLRRSHALNCRRQHVERAARRPAHLDVGKPAEPEIHALEHGLLFRTRRPNARRFKREIVQRRSTTLQPPEPLREML